MRSKRRPSKETFLQLLNTYSSPTLVGKQLGVSRITVHDWIKQYEIKSKLTYV